LNITFSGDGLSSVLNELTFQRRTWYVITKLYSRNDAVMRGVRGRKIAL
jgi:hypothetical protein